MEDLAAIPSMLRQPLDFHYSRDNKWLMEDLSSLLGALEIQHMALKCTVYDKMKYLQGSTRIINYHSQYLGAQMVYVNIHEIFGSLRYSPTLTLFIKN